VTGFNQNELRELLGSSAIESESGGAIYLIPLPADHDEDHRGGTGNGHKYIYNKEAIITVLPAK
jgi:hypothetical protein